MDEGMEITEDDAGSSKARGNTISSVFTPINNVLFIL